MELVNVTYLGNTADNQTYSLLDKSLINTNLVNAAFGQNTDYIEYTIYDINNTFLDVNYRYLDYKRESDVNINGTATTIYLDPEKIARDSGYDRGSVIIKFNFFRELLDSRPGFSFWIKETSTSRTEIKAARQDLSNSDLSAAFDAFNNTLSNNAYYPDFYLNFGDDIEIIGVNAVYVEEDGIGYIIFKLYQPLPQEYGVKSQFWVAQEVAQPVKFQVDTQIEADSTVDQFKLRGPNYDINLNQQVGQTTPYYNYDSLFSTPVSSSFQQLQSFFDENGIAINVDYSSFTNFIHFSSATERINNFVYKLSLIELYESSSAALSSITPGSTTNIIVSQSQAVLKQNIDNIIKKFDPYEYYLYYTSGSTAWPKTNNTVPYYLYSVTSSQALAWLGDEDTLPTTSSLSILYSASYYDNTNSDALRYTAPTYIRDDSSNQPYLTFLDMIGQHFDNIWIYYKDVTNRFSAENNPNIGISLDLVADALKGFGVQLYTNTNLSDNLYYSLLGVNATGSTLPITSSAYAQVSLVSSSLFPVAGNKYLSASLYLPPFENEKISRYVTILTTPSASLTSSFGTLSPSQLDAEYYKRIYHNLPYLLKTRGTERGIKALIACYGIPTTTLSVNEFGGYNIYSQGDILGIQDNKVYTGSVQELTASVLSPFTTLQEYVNDTERNSISLEIGFSPADSINANITSSLPNLSIQQLIGNPGLQYSSSYTPLVGQSNTYFTANYTSRYNVWDFIRLIKFYNNSLFKMLKDFVPARASISTGIIVKSHILERNKYPRKEPVATTSSYDDFIDMISITGSDGLGLNYPTNYTSTVQTLSGSVAIQNNYYFERYNGEFSGSILDVVNGNLPQYEQSYQVYQTGTNAVTPLQVPLNYLYQNVSGSPKSIRFLDLDYSTNQIVPVNYGLITKSIDEGPISLFDPYAPYAQLQDYNYYIKRSTSPRYAGSQLSGQRYNVYTVGDTTYGKDPTINYNTNRVGLFTQVETSSFIPGVVNATLGYLADVSGGLFELNQENRSWVDVQNIFKAGTALTVKQFDNRKYSNQKATDGVKTVYNSGYSYSPQLYFTSGADTKLYFNYAGVSSSTDFVATNGGVPNFYISGSPNPTYGVTLTTPATRQGDIYNIFDQANPSIDFAYGNVSTNTFPSYSARIAGVKTFTVNLDVNFEFLDPSQGNLSTYGQYTFGIFKNGTTLIGAAQTASFVSVYQVGGRTTGSITIQGPVTTNNPVSYGSGGTAIGPFLITSTSGAGPFFVGGPTSFITYGLFAISSGGRTALLPTARSADLAGFITPVNFSINPSSCTELALTPVSSQPINPTLEYTATRTISYTTPPESFSPGETAVFKFTQDVITDANFTSSVNVGSLTVTDVAGIGNYPYATSSLENFIADIKSPGVVTYDELILNDSITQYADYQFVPYFESGSKPVTSSLYALYGDTQYSFSPQTNDKIILRDVSGRTQDLDIVSVRTFTSASRTYYGLSVVPSLLSNWVSNPKLITRFLLLKKFKDEQNVILSFVKKPGLTSYGFLLPDNISNQVINNINTLQAAVQTQLLSNQSIPAIDLINGGSFGN